MRLRACVATVLVLGSSLHAPSGPRAQTKSQPPRMGQEWAPSGRVETSVGRPTTKGTWDGTWYYVSRDMLVIQLEDTEMDHAYYLEKQITLINLVGLANYQQSQMGSAPAA